jgi:hypothetical protein
MMGAWLVLLDKLLASFDGAIAVPLPLDGT